MLDENQVEERLRGLLRDPRWSISSGPGTEARIRGAAKWQRLRAASALAAVTAVLTAAIVVPLILLAGGGAASGGPHQLPAHALARSATVRTTITINPQIGQTFAPAPASAAPELTAQQAWARFMRHLGAHTAIPPGIRVHLGLYTLPAGSRGPGGTETYIDHDQLAYGYSSPSRCETLNPRLLPPPNARCIFWTFLNANTGSQIVSTYQKIGDWHWLFHPKGL